MALFVCTQSCMQTCAEHTPSADARFSPIVNTLCHYRSRRSCHRRRVACWLAGCYRPDLIMNCSAYMFIYTYSTYLTISTTARYNIDELTTLQDVKSTIFVCVYAMMKNIWIYQPPAFGFSYIYLCLCIYEYVWADRSHSVDVVWLRVRKRRRRLLFSTFCIISSGRNHREMTAIHCFIWWRIWKNTCQCCQIDPLSTFWNFECPRTISIGINSLYLIAAHSIHKYWRHYHE